MIKESQDAVESRRLAEVSNEIGMKYAREGRLADALQCFNEAVAWNDLDPAYHANLSWAHAESGEKVAAIAELQTALHLSRDSADAAFYANNLGALYLRMGFPQHAAEAFKAALKIVPGHEGMIANQKAAEDTIKAASDAKAAALRPVEQAL